MMFSSVLILEAMVVLGLKPLELMQYLVPPLELVQGGVKQLLILELITMILWAECECTKNVRKEKYVCTIFTVVINFHVNSRLSGFHDLMIFTMIVSKSTP